MDIQSSNLNITRIRIFTALASLLLSLQAVYFDDIINRDGIMYLQMSEAYLSGGIVAAKAIYDWPVFSILIAWLHQLTSLPIESCGFILNSFLFVVLTDALVLISRLLVTSQRQLSIAAILILCFIPINEYRDFILRDPGYWAFSSLALYQFMLFAISPSFKTATLWQVFIMVAILFRIEGVVILSALPLCLLFINPIFSGFQQFLQALYLAIAACVFGLLSFAFQANHSDAFGKLESLSSYLTLDKHLQLLDKYSLIIEQQILNQFSDDYASLILISGLSIMLLYKLLKMFSLSYIIIYFVTSSNGFTNTRTRLQKLLLYFLLLNILILTAFLFKEYFISSRYTVLALIGLLLLVMPRLCHGIEQLWLDKRNLLLSLVGFCLFYNIADATTLSSSKTYIKETALWAAHHLPTDSLVITDDEFLLYYFEREKTTSTLCVRKIFHQTEFLDEYNSKMPYLDGPCTNPGADGYKYYDYMIVVEKERHPELIAFLKTLELKQIYYQENTRLNDGASVYKVIK
jgi:hypothetical protein